MNYIQFKNKLNNFPIFSISNIRLIDENFDYRRLYEWQKKGYIKKIIKGYYVFTDVKLNENILFKIANKIYKPSYISFESALYYYNLIPEIIYSITSASTRRTYEFNSSITRFYYRTLKKEYFFGYKIIDNIKIASIEKAIVDYFYIKKDSLINQDDFSSIRINKDECISKINEKELYKILTRFNKKSLTINIENFLNWIKYA